VRPGYKRTEVGVFPEEWKIALDRLAYEHYSRALIIVPARAPVEWTKALLPRQRFAADAAAPCPSMLGWCSDEVEP
jgi:hypothetical protein